MIYFQKKNSKGEIVVSNLPAGFRGDGYSTKEFRLKDGSLILYTDDPILTKRAKTLRQVVEICSPAIDFINSHFVEQIKAHSHALKEIQGQLTQKTESLIDSPMFNFSKDYSEQRGLVSEKVKKNPDLAADVLIYLQKRITEIGAHIESFEIIHMGEQINLSTQKHNIRKVIWNVLYAFQDQFRDRQIKPIFKFDDEDAEQRKIKFDYKTINTVLYNFFDNVIKYAMPYSEIWFFFNVDDRERFNLRITMKSLRIEKEELQNIFNLWHRGKNAKRVADGSGVGMYVIKKALGLNNLSIKVEPDYSKMETLDGNQYIFNEFTITGRLDHENP